MCESKIILRTDGGETILADEVAFLRVTSEGIYITTVAGESKLLKGCSIESIDFLKHRVYVKQSK